MRRLLARRWLTALGMPLLLLAVLLFFARGVERLDAGQSQEALVRLEQAIRRSCVSYYAAEGNYPPDLDHLVSRYGLQIDPARYRVFYEPVGSNLMPQITVLECRP